MDKNLEEKIRKRAYEIWELKGYSGLPEDHWLDAERELAGAGPGSISAEVDPTVGPDEGTGRIRPS